MNSIELFAGAGGLGMGLHQAGFHPLEVVERDTYCCETIRENQMFAHPLVERWPLWQGDVREVDFSKFEGKLDLVRVGRRVSRSRWVVSTARRAMHGTCFQRQSAPSGRLVHAPSF